MAEATLDPTEAAALEEVARKLDTARMQQIGSLHFAMSMGALTMWGAAVAWAQVTGWALAEFAAVANALVAAYVISPTVHEWGHFAGARLSGAKSPVFEAPKRHFFLFDFPIAENDTQQFIWMSWGGILAPWLPVVLTLAFVPLGLTSGAALLAGFVYKAVSIAGFELPVVRRVTEGKEPGAALGERVQEGGLVFGRKIGLASGLALFSLLWLAA